MILLSQKEQERDPLHLFIPEGNSRINQLQNWKSNQSKEWVSSTSKSWKITQLFIWTLNLKKAVWMNQPNEYYSHKTNKRHEINRINNCWNENKNLFSFKKKKNKKLLKIYTTGVTENFQGCWNFLRPTQNLTTWPNRRFQTGDDFWNLFCTPSYISQIIVVTLKQPQIMRAIIRIASNNF